MVEANLAPCKDKDVMLPVATPTTTRPGSQDDATLAECRDLLAATTRSA